MEISSHNVEIVMMVKKPPEERDKLRIEILKNRHGQEEVVHAEQLAYF